MPKRSVKAAKNRYKGKKFYKIAGAGIFGLAGLLFAALPADLRQQIGLDFGLDPTSSMVLGIVFLVIAGLVYWKY
jgi:hypothetical protein